MYVTNLKIYDISFDTIQDDFIKVNYIKYLLDMNEIKIYFIEESTLKNTNKYLTVVSFVKKDNYIGLSIVSGGKNTLVVRNFDWGSTKSRNDVFKKYFINYCESKKIKFEILDEECVD